MSWTKRDYVNQAFQEIGLAEYIYDLLPEQEQTVLRRLDAMMAGWNSKGIRLGWPLPSSPDNSDIEQDTQTPDVANEAIYLNLAVRIAPMFGKTVSPETKINAKDAYIELIGKFAAPPIEMQFPSTLPRGQGSKPWRTGTSSPFVTPPTDPLQAGEDELIEFQ